jgi:hypothetical protein
MSISSYEPITTIICDRSVSMASAVDECVPSMEDLICRSIRGDIGWDKDVLELFSKCANVGTVIDVGAHIGLYTAIASVFGASRVIAIERSPMYFKSLQQTARMYPQADIVPILRVAGSEFPALVIDDILQSSVHIQCLKIDVSGNECDVLLGCRKLIQSGRVNHIFMNVVIRSYPDITQLKATIDDCMGLKYELFEIRANSMVPIHDIAEYFTDEIQTNVYAKRILYTV